MSHKPPAHPDAWQDLRRHTPARLALGRAGCGLPTRAHLAFQLDHARARDAVWQELDRESLTRDLAQFSPVPTLQVQSQARSREDFLQRPDRGRRLAPDTVLPTSGSPDLVIVLADGLSATALQCHAAPLLSQLMPKLGQDNWQLAPLVIATQARVALGDEIAHRLDAAAVLVLLGERPGLTAPDSLGAYLTWAPRPGTTDESRNCVSNIRPAGLDYESAAHRLRHLLNQARQRGLSGVDLKEDAEVQQDGIGPGNFLLPDPDGQD